MGHLASDGDGGGGGGGGNCVVVVILVEMVVMGVVVVVVMGHLAVVPGVVDVPAVVAGCRGGCKWRSICVRACACALLLEVLYLNFKSN